MRVVCVIALRCVALRRLHLFSNGSLGNRRPTRPKVRSRARRRLCKMSRWFHRLGWKRGVVWMKGPQSGIGIPTRVYRLEDAVRSPRSRRGKTGDGKGEDSWMMLGVHFEEGSWDAACFRVRGHD
jgi:hypothetical protein